MKITVKDQILSGNLGEGWADEHEAAVGLAKYYEEKLYEFVRAEYPEAEIIINMDVEYASGYSRGLAVYVTGTEDDYEIINRLEDLLPRISENLWEAWCGGDGSEYFGE